MVETSSAAPCRSFRVESGPLSYAGMSFPLHIDDLSFPSINGGRGRKQLTVSHFLAGVPFPKPALRNGRGQSHGQHQRH